MEGAGLDVRVLGPLEVLHDGAPVPLPAGRARELLLRFVVAGSTSLSVERVAADLWPESGHRTPTSTVRTYVARLRQALPDDVIVTRVGGYALDLSRLELDAERFEAEVRAAKQLLDEAPDRAAEQLRTAVARWRGRAFEDVADRQWAAATAAQLEEARLDALELEAEARLAAGGQAVTVASQLAELTRIHPLRERLWLHRMVALYRCGRQADALACYQQVRQLLGDELGIEPGTELRELERAILLQDPTLDEPTPPHSDPVEAEPPAASPTSATTLTTTLIGRAEERREVRRLLHDARIVTLTGPGGVGKSRLARELLTDVAPDHAGGAVTVDLATVADASEVVAATASALGVVRRGRLSLLDLLVDALGDADVVVLLDNCEHVAAPVADIATRLAAAPRLRLLVTSREPLGIRGEVVHPVDPLGVPDPTAGLHEILASEAVQLFEQRARVVARDFAVDEHNATTVARICRRLDGLPFAIELAAARMRVLTPVDIELRLDERFGLLTTDARADARHETLHEAIGWSYGLLRERERLAFRRLSLFLGAFDIRGATAVIDVGRDDEVIDLVAGLIDRSLLVVEHRREHVRYRMLETVRAFGREQLEVEGDLVSARNRHADHLMTLVTQAGELLHGPHELQGHALLEQIQPDLRAAFEWSMVAGRWTEAARIVASIPWERVGRMLQWELTTLARRLVAEEPPLPRHLAARVHATAAVGFWLSGDADTAHETGRRALDLAEQTDDETYVETALAVAWVQWESGDIEGASALYLPLADPSLGDRVADDVAAYCLGGMVMGMTEHGVAGASHDARVFSRRLVDAAIDLAERSGCPASLAMAHLARAYFLLDPDPAAAQAELERVAAVEGLALPTWALHARSHRARFRAAAGDDDGLVAELADILRSALYSVDDMHLRLIGGFVGGALTVAGQGDRAPSLRPLAVEAFTGPTEDGWRREVAALLDAPSARPPTPSLSGLDLEHAVRRAVDDLAGVTGPGRPG